MKDYIEEFSKHLIEGLEIGSKSAFNNTNKSFDNIFICGLGGSGIGGKLVSQLYWDKIEQPVTISNDYFIPKSVGKNTLTIACSYSGNTEETLEAMEKAASAGSEIAVVSSGGKIIDIAKEKGYNHIQIPEGYPPRAALGYSFVELQFILHHYGIISSDFINEVKSGVQLIQDNEADIKAEAKKLADALHGRTPVLYASPLFESVLIRFRQQLNENAKQLCWHHVFPELNHNELVGWASGTNDLSVIIFRTEEDYYRTEKRIDISIEQMKKFTSHITEVHAKGKTRIERYIYLIHLTDLVSVYLADNKKVDPIEIDVIIHLKSELSKI
ncbi:MAG: bifunctional phosphoglucose/phosphomannose isomerase [Crocinitomicaceae bacterium]